MRRPKYHSRYPSRLRKVVRRKLKDPYSAAHLQWVKSATDFRHRDAKTQMTASIVAARMAEEVEPLKWKRVSDKHYGTTEYHSHDGEFRIKKTGYHPTMGYAHRIKNGAWWTVHKKDEKLGVAPDYMVRQRSHRSLADAKQSASGWSRKMKTFKESADQEQHLYHVTHTHHVDSIKKHGINPMGGPSNWVQAGSGERYGKGEIYTFTHHDDAKKWAANMDWHHHQGMGTGKISIIKVRQPKDHPFEKDENDPIEVMSRKGPALKTMKRIDQKHIVGVQKVDLAMLKEEIDDDLIEAINEWGMMFESTESSLNSQWIERQQRRKNPKLKEEDDKEEEGEKIGKKTPTLDQIAKKHGVEEKELERQLEMGIKVEYEHTRSKEEAAEIARDHLDEFPDYYDRLEKMEKKAKKDIKEGLDHVIMSRSENGFWSNKHGWVYDKASATKFSKKEFEGKNKLRMPMSSGKDARLLHKDFVPQEFDESVNEEYAVPKKYSVVKKKIHGGLHKYHVTDDNGHTIATYDYANDAYGHSRDLNKELPKVKEEYMIEASGDGNPSNNKGVLHELLVGYHLRGGSHMDKHPDVKGDSPREAHDKLQAKISPDQYKSIDHRAKAAANDIHKRIKKEGRTIKDVHWTSKAGDIHRSTGVHATQKEDPSDIMIHTVKGERGTKLHHYGVSLKVTDRKSGHVPVSNPGMESTYGGGKILDKHRKTVLAKHPAIGKLTNAEQRKEHLRTHPRVNKSVREMNKEVVPAIAKHLHGKLSSLSTKDLADHLRTHILKTNPTPLQAKGHTHIKHTTNGVGGNYSFTHADPTSDHEHILKDHKNITVRHSGTSVIFEHKGKPFARHRLKFMSQSDPMSSIKGSGELIGSHKKTISEMVSMSVGGANIAGMPDADPPDLTPVGLGGKWQSKRKKKFAGRTVFTVDPGTYWKAYLGKKKYEHYEKYLDGCDIAEEIRAYGRKYWDEPIILQNEQTGAMIYLKYGSK